MRDSQHGLSVSKPSAKVKPAQDDSLEPLLRVADVASILSIHKISAYRLIYKRQLPYVKLEGCGIRVRPADLREYINNGRKHE